VFGLTLKGAEMQLWGFGLQSCATYERSPAQQAGSHQPEKLS